MNKKQFTDAFIEKYYDGDVEAFLGSRPTTDEDQKKVAYGASQAISWKEIEASAKCYPEYETYTLLLIEGHLGYLPKPATYIPHEPFIRSVVANYKSGNIQEEQFLEELDFHCRRIRNDDMIKFAEITAEKYTEKDYNRYQSHLSVYKQSARDRLMSFLGMEPVLEHSIDAETFLRQLFQIDIYHDKLPFCEIDYRAATIYKYREALMLHGKETAEASSLVGLLYQHERLNLP